MAKKILSKELAKQEPEELLRLLDELSRRFPVARMYLNMEFGLEAESIVEKYRKALQKEYFPTRGRGRARISRSDKILKEFGMISAFSEDLLEMNWFQVELAIRYHLHYMYEYEPFMKGLLRNWKTTVQLARETGSLPDYMNKLETIFPGEFRTYYLHRLLKDIADELPQAEED